MSTTMSMITNMTTDTSTNMSMSMTTNMGMTTTTIMDTITDMTTDMIMDTITTMDTTTGMTMITATRKPMTTVNMSWRIITLPIPMKRMWQAIRTNANARHVIPTKSIAIFAGRALHTANAGCRTRTMSSAFTN